MLAEDQILRIDPSWASSRCWTSIPAIRQCAARAGVESPAVAAVQVTLAEDFSVEDRCAFYDSVGALCDVVQNHLRYRMV